MDGIYSTEHMPILYYFIHFVFYDFNGFLRIKYIFNQRAQRYCGSEEMIPDSKPVGLSASFELYATTGHYAALCYL